MSAVPRDGDPGFFGRGMMPGGPRGCAALFLVALALYVLGSLAFLGVVVAVMRPPAAHAAQPDAYAPIVIYQRVEPRFTADDVMAALAGHSARVRCVTGYEIGGVGYDPYAISPEGDLGTAQLNPRGKLPRFFQDGYTNPFDPDQALAFEEHELPLDPGAWSPVAQGLC